MTGPEAPRARRGDVIGSEAPRARRGDVIGSEAPRARRGDVIGSEAPRARRGDVIGNRSPRACRGDAAVVVAVVPAHRRADSVAATVAALRTVGRIDRVVVVDDGSGDDTATQAAAAGATVVRLPVNVGKAGAVAAGVEAAPDADVVLLVDADVARTARAAEALLAPVLDDEADLVVGTLPPAEGKGGLGLVRRLAAGGIRRATGVEVEAPLSGQRAVDAALLRSLLAGDADDPDVRPSGRPHALGTRFGLEVAMTVDAVRAGARLVEVPVPMDHRHTGRGPGGFVHRGRQGVDIARALWPRLTGVGTRVALIVLATLVALGGLLVGGSASRPGSVAASRPAEQVVIVGIPHWSFDDVDSGVMPVLDELLDDGALAATSVRTRSGGPSEAEAYASLGAGNRVSAGGDAAGVVLPADAPLEGDTAAETLARRTGVEPRGEIVVPATPALIQSSGVGESAGRPGAMGQALADAGLRTAVVSNADRVNPDGDRPIHRPAALAVIDESGSVDTGDVTFDLIEQVAEAPYGLRADEGAMSVQIDDALGEADVVVVDTGDMSRTEDYRPLSTEEATEAARLDALSRIDGLVGDVVADAGDDTLLLVVGMTPPTGRWALTPTFAWGAGVQPGTLHSASTNRAGLVTITDLAPTVLDALDVPVPDGMIGQPLRYRDVTPAIADLQRMDELAGSREGVYYPMAVTFIVVQAFVYLLAAATLHFGGASRLAVWLRLAVLTCAAWPLATFVDRALPGIQHVGDGRQALVWLIAVAIAGLSMLRRGHALAPLTTIAGATVALLLVDVGAGAELQMSSVLGYSPHTAARFTGFGNTAFAVLAACAVVVAATHVAHAPRRREAVVAAAGFLLVVLVADVWPTLGADVGGVLTMVPVFGLVVASLAGRRISPRFLLTAGVATLAVLAVVAGVDLLRPEDARTHLGRFVTDSLRGDGTFLDTIRRKWETNVRLFGTTIWTWMVPITCAFMLYVLVAAEGWTRLLPPRSALRAGVVGTLLAGIIGWLSNDSGVVVSALVFVFIGPYLTLLALSRQDAGPELIEPGPPAPRPDGGDADGVAATEGSTVEPIPGDDGRDGDERAGSRVPSGQA